MKKYVSRITEFTVYPEGGSILSEGATIVKLVNEGAGEFIELTQPDEVGSIRLEPEELELIANDAKILLGLNRGT
jgi:hypothetical protein